MNKIQPIFCNLLYSGRGFEARYFDPEPLILFAEVVINRVGMRSFVSNLYYFYTGPNKQERKEHQRGHNKHTTSIGDDTGQPASCQQIKYGTHES